MGCGNSALALTSYVSLKCDVIDWNPNLIGFKFTDFIYNTIEKYYEKLFQF